MITTPTPVIPSGRPWAGRGPVFRNRSGSYLWAFRDGGVLHMVGADGVRTPCPPFHSVAAMLRYARSRGWTML